MEAKQEGRTGPRAWTRHEGLWFRNGALIIPRHNNLRQECLERHHDSPDRGHPGADRTALAVRRHFWWPTLSADAKAYVDTCDLCQRMKAGTQKPSGLLQPLPIPPATEKAKHWVIDYAVKLPQT